MSNAGAGTAQNEASAPAVPGGAASQPRARRSLRGAVLDGLLLLLLTLTFASFFADQAWLPDMLSFFRPQLGVVSVVLLLLALATRRLPRIAVALLLAGLNVWPLVLTNVPLAAAAPGPTVRVMSANLLGGTLDEAAFRRAVAEVKPDILVVQEASGSWRKVLEDLPGLPYRASQQLRFVAGVDVLSRTPLNARMLREVPYRVGVFGGGIPLRVTLSLDALKGRPVVIYAVHPPTPRTEAGWMARNRYLDGIAQQAGREPPGALVLAAGDWNTPFWSPYFGKTLAGSNLAAAERSAWPAPTRIFQEFGAPVWLGTPIDHIAVSEGLGVARTGSGPRTSSDHLPIFADIGLR